MITDDDVKKLKKTFVTKKDLKELKSDFDKRTDAVVKEITQLADVINSLIQPINDKLDDALHELRTHRIILGDHEERIQKVEHKYSS